MESYTLFHPSRSHNIKILSLGRACVHLRNFSRTLALFFLFSFVFDLVYIMHYGGRKVLGSSGTTLLK